MHQNLFSSTHVHQDHFVQCRFFCPESSNLNISVFLISYAILVLEMGVNAMFDWNSFEHDFVEEEGATELKKPSTELLSKERSKGHGNTVWNAKVRHTWCKF